MNERRWLDRLRKDSDETEQGESDWSREPSSDEGLSVEVRLRLALIELGDLVRRFRREEEEAAER